MTGRASTVSPATDTEVTPAVAASIAYMCWGSLASSMTGTAPSSPDRTSGKTSSRTACFSAPRGSLSHAVSRWMTMSTPVSVGFRETRSSSRMEAGLVMRWPVHEMKGTLRSHSSRVAAGLPLPRREATGVATTPESARREAAAASKRPSREATGSSTRSMPATETGPGMMRTWSAV